MVVTVATTVTAAPATMDTIRDGGNCYCKNGVCNSSNENYSSSSSNDDNGSNGRRSSSALVEAEGKFTIRILWEGMLAGGGEVVVLLVCNDNDNNNNNNNSSSNNNNNTNNNTNNNSTNNNPCLDRRMVTAAASMDSKQYRLDSLTRTAKADTTTTTITVRPTTRTTTQAGTAPAAEGKLSRRYQSLSWSHLLRTRNDGKGSSCGKRLPLRTMDGDITVSRP